MKSYEEIVSSVFEKRNIYIDKQNKRKKIIKAGSVIVCMSSVIIIVISNMTKYNDIKKGSSSTGYSIEATSDTCCTTQINADSSDDQKDITVTEITYDKEHSSTLVAGMNINSDTADQRKNIRYFTGVDRSEELCQDQMPAVTTVIPPLNEEYGIINIDERYSVFTDDTEITSGSNSIDIEST